jgi:hypothetical protein
LVGPRGIYSGVEKYRHLTMSDAGTRPRGEFRDQVFAGILEAVLNLSSASAVVAKVLGRDADAMFANDPAKV